MTALLMLSCNKNRYDLNQLETVEADGHWKLPVGSAHITIGEILEQFSDNELVSALVGHDENDNIRIQFKSSPQRLLSGTLVQDMLNHTRIKRRFEINNPFPGTVVEPISGMETEHLNLSLSVDSASVESVTIKSGALFLLVDSDLGSIDSIIVSSPDILEADGDPLVRSYSALTGNTIDLSGASFNLRNPESGELENLRVDFEVYYTLAGVTQPQYFFEVEARFINLKIREVRGSIKSFVLNLDFNTDFSIPFKSLSGQLLLRDIRLQIKERSSFENLMASLTLNQLELCGGGLPPYQLFGQPLELFIVPSSTFTNIMPAQTFDINLDTRYDSIRGSVTANFGSQDEGRPIVIRDDSALDFMIDATLPLHFKSTGVTFVDTMAFNLSIPETVNLDMLTEFDLSILLKSEIPLNIMADLYAYNTTSGRVVDTLVNNLQLDGSVDGHPVETLYVIDLVKELSPGRIDNLKKADAVIAHLNVNTADKDVVLNLDNGVSVTIKADLSYDEFDINSFNRRIQ